MLIVNGLELSQSYLNSNFLNNPFFFTKSCISALRVDTQRHVEGR